MNEFIEIIKSFGFPIFLVLYYLFVERPRQIKQDEENNKRFDDVMLRRYEIEGRTTEVITNNNNLLTTLTERINDLIRK